MVPSPVLLVDEGVKVERVRERNAREVKGE